MENLTAVWQEFVSTLRLYGNAASCLNEPCPHSKIASVESDLNFELPIALVELLTLNNSQKSDSKGVFKSVSGWDVYRRHTFLDVESIAAVYKTFVQVKTLCEEFGDKEIPFAADALRSSPREVFSINRDDQSVSLIWTGYTDPFNSPEWQVAKFARGNNLIEFVRQQVSFYQ